MAALGLTNGSQLAIGANIYKLKYEFTLPAPKRWEIVHQVPLSTSWPVKVLGYERMTISGQIEVLGSAVHEAIADILSDAAERKISFVTAGTEIYIYAKAGSVSGWRPKSDQSQGAATEWLVSFSFGASRTGLYKASDDSVLWGG